MQEIIARGRNDGIREYVEDWTRLRAYGIHTKSLVREKAVNDARVRQEASHVAPWNYFIADDRPLDKRCTGSMSPAGVPSHHHAHIVPFCHDHASCRGREKAKLDLARSRFALRAGGSASVEDGLSTRVGGFR